MDRDKNDIAFSFSSAAAIIVNIIFWLVATQESVQSMIADKFGQVNLILFFLSILLYSVVFIISYNIFNRKEDRRLFQAPKRNFLISFIIVGIINAAFLMLQFINANQVFASVSDSYIWHEIPIALIIVALVSFFAAFLSITNRVNAFSSDNSKRSNIIFWAFGIVIALIAGFANYYPNLSSYHFDAYYTSVYNVSHGTPYSDIFGSIYGHYAIFFVPVFSLARLLGAKNMLAVFALCMAVITFIVYVLVTYSISIFVKNKSIRFLGVCAMAFTLIAMRGEEVYYQVNPHRTITIAITMALIAFAVKYPNKMKLITGIGFALCALMIVWSTEMGLIATATWIAFLISLELQKIKLKSFISWGKMGLYFVFGALSFLAAWGVVDLYNILNGGNLLTFKGFMHPYLARIDVIETLTVPLNNITTSWIFVLFLFLYFLGKGIFSTKLCNRVLDTNPVKAAQLAVSLLGLGSMTYFINRPAYYNLDIILSVAVLLLCIMAQEALPYIKALFNRNDRLNYSVRHGVAVGFGMTALFALFTLSLGTFVNMSSNLEAKEDYRQKASLIEVAKQVSENVPADTKAWGITIPEVYTLLDWDMELYCADYEDMYFYPNADRYIGEQLKSMKNEAFLTTDSSMEHFRELPEAYEAFFESHYISNLWGGAAATIQYYLPLDEDQLIQKLPDFSITAGDDLTVKSQKIEIQRNASYYVSLRADTDEAPPMFYVDFCGEGYDLETCQVNITISPEVHNYSAKISSGDVELPEDVYIRIVALSNSDIEIKDFKIYKL